MVRNTCNAGAVQGEMRRGAGGRDLEFKASLDK